MNAWVANAEDGSGKLEVYLRGGVVVVEISGRDVISRVDIPADSAKSLGSSLLQLAAAAKAQESE